MGYKLLKIQKENEKSLNHSILLIGLLVLTFTLSPLPSAKAEAQTVSPRTVSVIDTIQPLITAADLGIKVQATADKLKPTVPTKDKETSKVEFIKGITLKISQFVINRMVDSTIKWANSGFEGRPAYAINPGRYFRREANIIAGEFIEGSDLNFLCSPFERSLRVSLARTIYQPPEDYYQCTWNEALGNIKDFYSGNFEEGGWKAWFTVTQNPTSNPYGAYLTAKADVDSRVAQATRIQELELNWNQGFLSIKPCLRRAAGTDECLEFGSTKTPGTLVQSGLEKIVNAEFAQLLDVERFDQLLGALMGGLMDKYIFSPDGLFRKNPKELDIPTYDGYTYPDDEYTGGGEGGGVNPLVSCSSDVESASVGSLVIWSSQTTLTNPEYSWSGDELPDGIDIPSVPVTYRDEGEKSASLSITGLDATGETQTVSAACSNSVIINGADGNVDF